MEINERKGKDKVIKEKNGGKIRTIKENKKKLRKGEKKNHNFLTTRCEVLVEIEIIGRKSRKEN